MIEATNKLELAEFRLSQIQPEVHPEPSIDFSALETRRDQLIFRKRELSRAVDDLKSNWDEFRRHALLATRSGLIGKDFGDFQTDGGKSFKNAVVSRIDDLGVTLQHAHGSARLRFDDLAPGEQAFFGLDPEFAAVALAEERENLVAYDRRLNLEMQAIRQDEKAALAERKAEENRSASRLAIAQASARAASVSSSPLSSSFGRLGQTSRRSYSTYYSYRRPTTRYRSVYSYGSCRRPAAAWNQYSATPIRPYQPSPCLPAFRPHAVQYFNP